MHCSDVIEELAASAEPASAALAEHLASCPECAAWAERDARLSRLWEATRPQEPTAAAWATIWADLTHKTLPTPPAPVVPLAPLRPWQRWAPATFGIAQAAAFLAGAVWLGSQPSPTPLAFAKVEIPASDGALVMIQTDGTDRRVVSLVADDRSSAVDPSFDMLGILEAMAIAKVEIPTSDGAFVLIQSDGTDLKVVSLDANERSSAVDPSFDMLGILEAMAE